MSMIFCCFTGHRVLPIGEITTLERRLKDELVKLIRDGVKYFYAGGALGFDTLAAQTVLNLRETNPEVELCLLLPCTDQAKGWKEADIMEYERIKRLADHVTVLSGCYDRGCMFRRNQALVNAGEICVCYQTRKSGGTAYTVALCEKKGIPVINIARFSMNDGDNLVRSKQRI